MKSSETNDLVGESSWRFSTALLFALAVSALMWGMLLILSFCFLFSGSK